MSILELAKSLRNAGWPGCPVPDRLLWVVERLLDEPFLDEQEEALVAAALEEGWRLAKKV